MKLIDGIEYVKKREPLSDEEVRAKYGLMENTNE
jgi:hypothetical protein